MNTNDTGKNSRLDEAIRGLHESEPVAADLDASAARVKHRLATTTQEQVNGGTDVVRNCDGFVEMIPAYLEGTLAAARRELFEDHTRSCVSCRRALWQATGQQRTAVRPELSGWSDWRRWGLAAAAVLLVGFGLKVGVLDRLQGSPEQARAVAERIDGTLFSVQEGQLRPIMPGQAVDASEVVRTGRNTRAVLRLADGTRVELNEHSELAVNPRRHDLELRLGRGDVIVEAAKQEAGRRLVVSAPDCEVAVKGTVFTVSSGPKGSRVSVLEGEVWVEQGKDVTKLAPGDQKVTHAGIAPVPVAAEVAWSSDPQRYAALVRELSEVSRQMMAKLANVPLRYESQLLPLLPNDTFIYAAVPNITREVADAGLELERRIQANPRLKTWFAERRQANPGAPDMAEVLTRFRELGSHVGNEWVMAVHGAVGAGQTTFVLMAEATDEAGLVAAIHSDLQRLSSHCGEEIPVVVVTDPTAIGAQTGNVLYVLVHGGLVAATDSRAEITRLANATPVNAPSTPFFAQIARCYEDGVSWLFAADAERITAGTESTDRAEWQIAEELGLHDMRIVLFEHKHIASQGQLRGLLGFSRERRGIPAWLGAPAPMGSLEFVSPNAYAVGCVLAKEPSQIADEVLSSIRRHDPDGLASLEAFEREHGFSLREDLAAPLGGEMLLAIDGPVLPKPAWKLVVAVEDAGRLQGTLARLVAEASAHLVAKGKPALALSAADEGGLTLYTLASADGRVTLHWTFWDGYWLLAAQKALLREAVGIRQSGLSLPTTSLFRNALPADGQQHYSALVFVNASSLGPALASALPDTANAHARTGLSELRTLLSEAPAMSVGVTAERERIVLTSRGIDLLNPGRMLSLLGSFQAPAGSEAES